MLILISNKIHAQSVLLENKKSIEIHKFEVSETLSICTLLRTSMGMENRKKRCFIKITINENIFQSIYLKPSPRNGVCSSDKEEDPVSVTWHEKWVYIQADATLARKTWTRLEVKNFTLLH